ncbi:hypothetical protein QCD60_03630 [Pokkaliibacter sp. MBI-7]|uniref:hypothetical protein n=1 Tax=Pokkaliibacter sp. MBI-7 TaxID=3040600 RepID=UPI00244CF1C6|nr:hypothetical protein [Pokkaliibacter sp. MBI-7]MDH2431643.1 hypothetical protein [Pokkaliibacter sp. MBI-7]
MQLTTVHNPFFQPFLWTVTTTSPLSMAKGFRARPAQDQKKQCIQYQSQTISNDAALSEALAAPQKEKPQAAFATWGFSVPKAN